MELLKLFGTDLSDGELRELKLVLSRFYAEKAMKAADAIWENRGMSDDDMDQLLNEPS